jgi:NAD(P)-dependent dehydrogenase (short-subunit alcohol dehydrogenase family)
MDRLRDRVAVITGAARGLGYGIAERFAAEGASLVLVDLLGDLLEQAATTLRKSGARVESLVADITAEDTPAQIVSRTKSSFGSIDVLVNNAGVGVSGSIEQFTHEEWDRTISVNLSAAFRISRAVIPKMVERSYGRIINISSICGLQAMRQDSAYAVTKIGLIALTRSIAVDYGRYGITSNAIAPGTIETPLSTQILKAAPKWASRTYAQSHPIPGLGRMSDIAAAAAFFASDDARFVTGQVLAVDGGWSATRFVPDHYEGEVAEADSDAVDAKARFVPENLGGAERR